MTRDLLIQLIKTQPASQTGQVGEAFIEAVLRPRKRKEAR